MKEVKPATIQKAEGYDPKMLSSALEKVVEARKRKEQEKTLLQTTF